MFLKHLIFKFIEVYNFFLKPYNNNIYKVHLNYKHNGQLRPSTKKYNSFWKNEEYYWRRSGKPETCWADVTGNYKDKKILKKPKQVKNMYFRMKYWYSGNKYICLNTIPSIPEKDTKKSMKFTLPIKTVRLLNSAGEDFNIDITKKYIKYLGPQKNFHSCADMFIVSDLFPYEGYDTIEIVDIVNSKKTFSIDSSVIHLL